MVLWVLMYWFKVVLSLINSSPCYHFSVTIIIFFLCVMSRSIFSSRQYHECFSQCLIFLAHLIILLTPMTAALILATLYVNLIYENLIEKHLKSFSLSTCQNVVFLFSRWHYYIFSPWAAASIKNSIHVEHSFWKIERFSQCNQILTIHIFNVI